VIKFYGILNDQIAPEDGFFFGIPYPGVYVTGEEGTVVAKYFHGTYKKRDSSEMLIAAATGDIMIDEAVPIAFGGDADIKLTATIHGGTGNLRQGVVREFFVRFDLAEGLHIYGAPVPDGMVATEVTVDGPIGLIVGAPILPPVEPLTLAGMGATLQVWGRVVDIRVPIYSASELATEVAPLNRESVPIEVTVRYQACDHETRFLPRTEKFTLEATLHVTEVPTILIHQGHGQREGNYDGTPHWKRLLKRKRPSRRPI
jgi:hypothetical protein